MSITPEKLRACAATQSKTSTWAPIMVSECGMLADAMQIADDCARSDVECNTTATVIAGVRWYDVSADPDIAPEGNEAIALSVRYLMARGLIERNGDMVRFTQKP